MITRVPTLALCQSHGLSLQNGLGHQEREACFRNHSFQAVGPHYSGRYFTTDQTDAHLHFRNVAKLIEFCA